MHPCLIYLEKLEYTLQIFPQTTSATCGYEFNELFLCVGVHGLGLGGHLHQAAFWRQQIAEIIIHRCIYNVCSHLSFYRKRNPPQRKELCYIQGHT